MARTGSKADRRHHYARVKKRRANYWGWGKHRPLGPMPPRTLGRVARTPKPCSASNCSCCYWGKFDPLLVDLKHTVKWKESYREYMITTGEDHDSRTRSAGGDGQDSDSEDQ